MLRPNPQQQSLVEVPSAPSQRHGTYWLVHRMVQLWGRPPVPRFVGDVKIEGDRGQLRLCHFAQLEHLPDGRPFLDFSLWKKDASQQTERGFVLWTAKTRRLAKGTIPIGELRLDLARGVGDLVLFLFDSTYTLTRSARSQGALLPPT